VGVALTFCQQLSREFRRCSSLDPPGILLSCRLFSNVTNIYIYFFLFLKFQHGDFVCTQTRDLKQSQEEDSDGYLEGNDGAVEPQRFDSEASSEQV
jgi:hypothetical protein